MIDEKEAIELVAQKYKFRADELMVNVELLDDYPDMYIIGQLSGIDGYLPAVASAIVAEYAIDCKLKGLPLIPFPTTAMIGGFTKYISTKNSDYQPITSSFNLLYSKDNYYAKSLSSLKEWTIETKYYDNDFVETQIN
jgi:folate-dependent tRNA-U54 methylase TrmFO/GidA